MLIIGCDFHTRYQQIAMMDEGSGELVGAGSLTRFVKGADFLLISAGFRRVAHS